MSICIKNSVLVRAFSTDKDQALKLEKNEFKIDHYNPKGKVMFPITCNWNTPLTASVARPAKSDREIPCKLEDVSSLHAETWRD